MIKNIAFDLGGVVLALSYEQAVRRFEEVGLKDARQQLDAFEQRGIFGDLESGRITAEDFRRELSKMVGNAPANKLFDLVKVQKKCDGAPRKFEDYEVTIDRDYLPAGVTIEDMI